MSLASGARLGPYEIVAPIGARGMGEVYRSIASTLNVHLDQISVLGVGDTGRS